MESNILYLGCPEVNGILHWVNSVNDARIVFFRLLNN